MVSIFDGLLLGAFALLALYRYMNWNFGYWKKRGIACDDEPSFLFGSLSDSMLGRKSLGAVLNDLYTKFPGKKVVGFFQFRQPALLVREPKIIRKILVTDFHAFQNNDITIDSDADPIMGKNIFVLKNEDWKRSRALITPTFTSGKIKAVFSSMQEVAKELITFLMQHPEEMHVKPVMSRYTTEVVARCGFGIEGNSLKEPQPEMYELGKMIWEPNAVNTFKMLSVQTMPTISKLLRLKVVPSRVLEFFDFVLRDVIVYRQEKNVERNDLVQYFIDVKRKSEEVAKGNVKSEIVTEVFTDEDILAGCITFFVDGYETTAVTLGNVLHQLAIHKDIQEKLRAEVDEVLRDGELTFEKLHAMNYLHMVYAETQRIQPALYKMQKVCTETYELDEGTEKPLVIEEGTPVVIPIYAVQNDPLNWESPEEFKPERFSSKESEAKAKSQGIYMPFSDGPRVCPGARIATTMVKLAVVRIVSELEILPTSSTPKKLVWDTNPIIIYHKGGINLKFVKRSL